jgi:hypothetical protein
MTKLFSKQKKNIRIRNFFWLAFLIVILLIKACTPKTKNSKQIETVTKALDFLQNLDSTSFYSLIDTSSVIELKGKEGMSNEVETAAYFLKKFGAPKASKYKVINHELTDYKSAEIIVPIVQNDASAVKDMKITFEFVRFLPQTKIFNFYVTTQSTPTAPITPIPKNQ